MATGAPMIIAVLAGAFTLACAGTWTYRRYALRRRWLDVPNERSSHDVPTPRGGGVAMTMAFLAAAITAWRLRWVSDELFIGVCGAALWIATLGFFDDRRGLPVRWRLPLQVVAPIWAIYWLGGLPEWTFGGFTLPAPWVNVAAVLYSLWLLNLYNFMDGIDGIASIEAITASLGAALLYFFVLPGSSLWALPLVVGAASAGFLVWNYPPARIFMGDVGSGFLGMTFAVLSLHASTVAAELFWAWVILLGLFIADATTTLCRRLLQGRPPHEAHRTHAYQYAARRFNGHAPVALAVAVINVIWLWPAAFLVGTGRVGPVVGVTAALAPLVALALHLKAGVAEAQEAT